MKIELNQLPQGGLAIIHQLNCAGFEAWFVGGCVRDLLMGQTPHDWDICTNALPEKTEHVFENYVIHETGISHGTVLVMVGRKDMRSRPIAQKAHIPIIADRIKSVLSEISKAIWHEEILRSMPWRITQSTESSTIIMDAKTLKTG